MTRRVLLRLLVALTVAVAPLAACSDDGEPARTPITEPSTSSGDDTVATSTTTPTGPVEEPVRLGQTTRLVPRPAVLRPTTSTFPLRPETVIVVAADLDVAADDAIGLLRSTLGPSAGLELPVIPAPDGRPTITFGPATDGAAPESHRIAVTEGGVEITAADHDGFVWAVQTLLQVLPAEVHATERQPGTFALPTFTIEDTPRFAWRGAMLDITRHWFEPDDIEAYVDQLSAYKLNRLHLHLSDDQGWRIEIRSHPELTEIGGASEVGGGEGGFLTQDDYRALVEHAARRGVTIVPEIDTPGHTNAALNAIPELNCDGVAPDLYTGTQVGFSSLCIDKELTYEWFDDVIGELAEMTPGEWIHLGGDESHSTPDEAYRRFVTRALGIVRDHGKTPIGWEEIGTAELGGDAVLQHWREAEPTVAGLDQGASVIASPAPKAYLDMAYVDGAEGNDWAGTITTETAYGWDPATLIDGLAEDRILGVEAPLWTELISDRETIQQRTLPRLPAIAEIGWSPQADRDWADFRTRIAAHAARWDRMGWAWTPDAGIDWPG